MSATSSMTSTAARDLARRIVAHLDDTVRDEVFILGKAVRELEEYVSGVVGKSAVCVSSAAVGLQLLKHTRFSGAEILLAEPAGASVHAIITRANHLVQDASALWGSGGRGRVLVRDFAEETTTVPLVTNPTAATAETVASCGSAADACPPTFGRIGKNAQTVGTVEIMDFRRLATCASNPRTTGADALVIHGSHDFTYAAGDFGIVACDATTAERLRTLRNHGRDGLGTYLHAQVGFNNRMDEVQARLLLEAISNGAGR